MKSCGHGIFFKKKSFLNVYFLILSKNRFFFFFFFFFLKKSSLICADVGCGRFEGKHALAHYHASGHAYSLELATGRIWDYAGDT